MTQHNLKWSSEKYASETEIDSIIVVIVVVVR